MAWQQWNAGGAPVVPGLAGLVSPAPVVNPAGVQYTPEQWAQMQQQNWQQWAQWQQQYQQWHQQYGAEYQKSMSALSQTAAIQPPVLNTSLPPPLPPDVKQPQPLPPEEPLKDDRNFNPIAPPNFTATPPNFSAPPPNFQPNKNFRNNNQNKNSNTFGFNPNNRNVNQNKPPSLMSVQIKKPEPEVTKKTINKNDSGSSNSSAQSEDMSETEKKFIKQFTEWEAQFNKWKEQNANHPDKEQYKEYEKKWETWRTQLLERREQMRKKRLGIVDNSQKIPVTQPLTTPPKFHPPNPTFEPPPVQDDGSTFLKLTSSEGIPGLDLVGVENFEDKEEEASKIDLTDDPSKSGPDFEAISKGINSILGDQKLMSILSMVSQNQKIPDTPIVTDVAPKIQEPKAANPERDFDEVGSNRSNFDEHSRSSWGNKSFDKGPVFRGRNQENYRNLDNDSVHDQDSGFRGPDNFQGPDDFRGPDDSFQSPDTFQGPDNFQGNRSDRFGNQNFAGPNNFQQNDNRDFSYNNRRGGFRGRGGFNRNDFDSNQSNFEGANDWNQNNQNYNQDEFQEDYDYQGNDDQFNEHANEEYYEEYAEEGYDGNYDDGYNQDGYNQEGYGEDFGENFEHEENVNHPSEEVQENEDDLINDDNRPLWQPTTVTEYDHKSLKSDDIKISIEPLRTFDYRHKPVNRIPLPQRPTWLKKTLRNCREFDFAISRYDLQPSYNRYSSRYGDRRRPDEYRSNQDRNIRNKYDEEKHEEPPSRGRFEESERVSKDRFEELEPKRSRYEEVPPSKEFDFEKDFGRRDARREDSDSRLEMKLSPPPSQPHGSNLKNVTLIQDVLSPPGRFTRPARIVIILRGPPGSGKTFLAKLIKDKEVENGGSAPRILSLDDYFMVEQEKVIEEDGKKTKVKVMEYEYDRTMEVVYRNSLFKAFKKTITDGYFPFIIVDNINDKVKYFGEMWSFAKQNGFQVYICQLEFDLSSCTKRNVHNRSESEIKKIIAGWEPTPAHHPSLDATSLVQSASILEVEMEEINSPPSDNFEDEDEREEGKAFGSRWDNFDCSHGNLAKLDDTSKPLRASKTMEDYLQVEDEWEIREAKPGQKRVRWADLELRKQVQKMRAIGFVVGQTNWNRMMDPTAGDSALTQTKYIERLPRYNRD